MKRISYRQLTLLTFGPLMGDLLIIMFMFLMNVGAVRMGIPPRTQAWIGAMFAIGYSVSAFLAGRWVTSRRAEGMIIAALVTLAAAGTLCVVVPVFWVFLVVAAVVGFAGGHYFVSLQIKLGNARPFRALAWTIAFYNVSWGSGCAFGPFIAGFLRGKGDLWLIAIAWGLLAAHMVVLAVARHAPAFDAYGVAPAADFSSTRLLRQIGWIGAFTSNVLMGGLLATLWPSLGAQKGLTDRQIGFGMFIMLVQIPLWAGVWALLRRRLVAPRLLIGMMALNGLSFLAIPFVPAWPESLALFAVVGTTFSAISYHCVYYSNSDLTTHGRSVGTNEMVLGVGNILGPLCLGWLAWNDAASPRPYLAGGILMFAAAAAATALWRRQRAALLCAATRIQ